MIASHMARPSTQRPCPTIITVLYLTFLEAISAEISVPEMPVRSYILLKQPLTVAYVRRPFGIAECMFSEPTKAECFSYNWILHQVQGAIEEPAHQHHGDAQ